VLEFRSLGTGGVADPRYISLYCLPDICYHVKFGSSATKGVCINNKERQKLGSAGTPPLWGGGVADHPNTSPICVTTSNLVVRRQLQQPTGWCQQPIATKAPSHPERCRSSCYRSQKIRAYDAHPTWSSLAAGSTADHVQDSSSGLQVSARHGSTVPSDILWADVNSCHPASSIRSFRPSSRLTVPRTRTNYGDRSFAVQGPRVWNSLSAALRAPDITLTTFRNKLKIFLFIQRICNFLATLH